MTTQPRLARLWRRLFPKPTGRRRAGHSPLPPSSTALVVPPKPTYPPPTPVVVPSRDEVFDQVMRRIGRQADHVATGRPTIPHPRPPQPTRPVPPPRPPRPTSPAAGGDGVEAPQVVVKITSMPTPPGGTPLPPLPPSPGTVRPDDRTTAAHAASPTDVTAVVVPPCPDLTPDEYLLTRGWERLFDEALRREDLVSFTVRHAGATVRLTETTLEIPKILDPAERVPHLCRHCHALHGGDKLTGRLWRCDGCHQIAAY